MPRIFLSLGSNVDPEANLRLAVDRLAAGYGELETSPVYRNPAVGFDGDDFLNLVVACATDESIADIATRIERIHTLAGRERGAEKFSARTLDIDLLLYGDTIASEPVVVPRPDVLRYGFVLKPLVDIAADAVHPVTGRTYASHWADMRDEAAQLTPVELSFD